VLISFLSLFLSSLSLYLCSLSLSSKRRQAYSPFKRSKHRDWATLAGIVRSSCNTIQQRVTDTASRPRRSLSHRHTKNTHKRMRVSKSSPMLPSLGVKKNAALFPYAPAPTSREEAISLHYLYEKMMRKYRKTLQADEAEVISNALERFDRQALLDYIMPQLRIIEVVKRETIRQVAGQCSERGDLLTAVMNHQQKLVDVLTRFLYAQSGATSDNYNGVKKSTHTERNTRIPEQTRTHTHTADSTSETPTFVKGVECMAHLHKMICDSASKEIITEQTRGVHNYLEVPSSSTIQARNRLEGYILNMKTILSNLATNGDKTASYELKVLRNLEEVCIYSRTYTYYRTLSYAYYHTY